jgi:mRNA-degrading endonuclease YafQ of YafQ-DinJ toxin-antitoxin module
MNEAFSMKIGMERCTKCGHRWIDYEGVRGSCFLCGCTDLSECISLREIRDAIITLRKEDKKYLDKHAKRTVILKQRYREIAELSLQRAQEVYAKTKDHYINGNLSDKVVDQLILAFRLFSELGVHKSAASCAYMAAMGYAQRGIGKEVHALDDLNDLVAARQWFMRLGSKEWEAAVNLHIGEKSMATIGTDPNLLQTMAQVSVWHFYRARDYYFENKMTKMVDRIQFDIGRATQLLTTYSQGASQIEAAKIAAQSTMKHGENVRKGLESLGQSVQYGLTALGEHIENYGGSLSRAIQASSVALSANVTKTMFTLAASSKLRGRSLDKRMSEVGQLLSTTAREIPDAHFQSVKELGSKFALGAVGSATTSDVTNEPSVVKLVESVLPDVKKSEESLKHLDEPAIKLTGTLFDMLVSKGIDKVTEELEAAESSRKGS